LTSQHGKTFSFGGSRYDIDEEAVEKQEGEDHGDKDQERFEIYYFSHRPHAQLEDTSDLITGLVELGLGSYSSGLDNVRNVVGSPLAGIDSLEDFDTRQIW